MYMGAKVTLLLTTAEYKNKSAMFMDLQYFLKKVQEFYIEAASQIQKKFLIGDPLIKMFEVLDPNTSQAIVNYSFAFLLLHY